MNNIGVKLVYKRIFTKEFMDTLNSMTEQERNEILKHERQQGIEFVKKLVPTSAFRAYCDCCNGDGPDISPGFYPYEDSDGNFRTDFYVNFDFQQE